MRPASSSPKWTSLTVPKRQRSGPAGRASVRNVMPWRSYSVPGSRPVDVLDGEAVVERGGVVGDGGQLDGHDRVPVRPRGGPAAAGSAGSTTAR